MEPNDFFVWFCLAWWTDGKLKCRCCFLWAQALPTEQLCYFKKAVSYESVTYNEWWVKVQYYSAKSFIQSDVAKLVKYKPTVSTNRDTNASVLGLILKYWCMHAAFFQKKIVSFGCLWRLSFIQVFVVHEGVESGTTGLGCSFLKAFLFSPERLLRF